MTALASGAESPSADTLTAMLTTLGRLWLAGVDVDWTRFYQDQSRRRVPLPTYPFERQRYWLDWIDDASGSSPQIAARPTVRAIGPSGKQTDLTEWFFVPSWIEAPLVRASPGAVPMALAP